MYDRRCVVYNVVDADANDRVSSVEPSSKRNLTKGAFTLKFYAFYDVVPSELARRGRKRSISKFIQIHPNSIWC
ncbi:MAG: hypothetical protein CMJ64_29000 [Planctomycetaceae bacterium]|nr:hypothetical protein [Planctomycetaceae bacterium]